MELRINQDLEPQSWDHFVQNHPNGNLLQSWVWGDFQEALGNKIWRLRVVDESNKTLSQLLAIKQSVRMGKHLIYAPRDLFINKTTPAHSQHQAMKLIVDHIKSIAKSEGAILLRVDPPITHTDTTSLSVYRSLGFMPSTKSIQPAENLMLDISIKEPNILSQMKQKTRYNINVANKKGVTVRQSNSLEDIKIFTALTKQTSRRSGFKSHTSAYYQTQFETLVKSRAISLFIAQINDTPLATILVTYYGNTATYLHGASSREHKELMASHLLQWEAIKEAKQRGCTRYDFGGVSVTTHHPSWSGITRFKLGFGGNIIHYAEALDLPLQPTWFRLYHAINKLRG